MRPIRPVPYSGCHQIHPRKRGLGRASRPASTITESAENRCAQRRHGLERPPRNPASNSHGRLRSGVDLFGRASRGLFDLLRKVHHYLLKVPKNCKMTILLKIWLALFFSVLATVAYATCSRSSSLADVCCVDGTPHALESGVGHYAFCRISGISGSADCPPDWTYQPDHGGDGGQCIRGLSTRYGEGSGELTVIDSITAFNTCPTGNRETVGDMPLPCGSA